MGQLFWAGKHAVITGGAGMIGSHLAELLLEAGAQVTVLDDYSRGHNLIAGARYILGDATGLQTCLSAFSSADVVFNLAAKVTSIDYNSMHHAEMFSRNMLLQSIPLEAAHRVGVGQFLQCSTVCVYPHDSPLPTPENAAEVNRPEPTNAGYGFAKLMGEYLAQWYTQEYGMRVAITRFANAYGPRDYFDWETSHVIPALIRKCLEQPVIEMWGGGEQRREFLFARDAAEGMLRVMECSVQAEPVNIGTGQNISINELLALIQRQLGTSKPVRHIHTKPTGHRERLADHSRLKQLTGWVPQTDLVDGLRQAIAWYRERVH